MTSKEIVTSKEVIAAGFLIIAWRLLTISAIIILIVGTIGELTITKIIVISILMFIALVCRAIKAIIIENMAKVLINQAVNEAIDQVKDL